jgi:hypothetical protein
MGYSEGAMRLGPVARKLIDPCAWKDGYPGPPVYVRELDALLHFANQNGYLWRRTSVFRLSASTAANA